MSMTENVLSVHIRVLFAVNGKLELSLLSFLAFPAYTGFVESPAGTNNSLEMIIWNEN